LNEDGTRDVEAEAFWRAELFVVNNEYKKGFFSDNSDSLTSHFVVNAFSEGSRKDFCNITA
jgi:hypothetical protein